MFERFRQMTTIYLEKALWGLFHTRPKWCARAWNDAAETMPYLHTSAASLCHTWRLDWSHCTYAAVFLFKISIWFRDPKVRGAKTNYIELGSVQSNTITGADWAKKNSCMLTTPSTVDIWIWCWQCKTPLAANGLCIISRDVVVWILPMASFPRKEQKNLHSFS